MRFGELKKELLNAVLVGEKDGAVIYPKTFDGMVRLLRYHKNIVGQHGGERNNNSNNHNNTTGVTFTKRKRQKTTRKPARRRMKLSALDMEVNTTCRCAQKQQNK